MTIPLTSSSGFFVRSGHAIGPLIDLNALRGGPAGPQVGTGAGYPTRFGQINTDYAASTALPKTVAKSADNPFQNLATWSSAQALLFNWAKQLIADTLGAMYNLDQPTALPEDSPYNATTALKYLINQMQGSTISSPTAGLQAATTGAGAQTGVNTPQGTPVFVFSLKNVQGLNLQLVFPETIFLTCTQDTQGGAALGNEAVAFAGETAVSDVFSHLYPAGSGASGTLTLVNAEKNNDGNTVLYNGGFGNFSNSNYPDDWVISVGAAGATVLDGGSGDVYTTGNTHVLEFAGDGATLAAVTQSFGTPHSTSSGAGGTPYVLLPSTQYALSAWVKVKSAVPAAGVLELALIDGAGNVLTDDNGASQLKTFDLTSGGLNIGTVYTNINCVFRTPNNLTTQTTPFKLRLRQSTALTNGKNAYIARLSMAKMSAAYTGGPFLSGFSSNVRPIAGVVPDQWTVAISNNYNTSGTGLMQQWMDRIFNLRSLGLQFPYKGASVLDSLIL